MIEDLILDAPGVKEDPTKQERKDPQSSFAVEEGSPLIKEVLQKMAKYTDSRGDPKHLSVNDSLALKLSRTEAPEDKNKVPEDSSEISRPAELPKVSRRAKGDPTSVTNDKTGEYTRQKCTQ